MIAAALIVLSLLRADAPGTLPPDALLVSLQQKLDSLKTLRGRFEQSLESATLGRARAESGRFYLKRPGLMRWEYEAPEKKLAVVDGTHTWLYLPEDREVYRGSAARLDQAGAAALLLTGAARLTTDYTARRVTLKEIPATGAAGAVAIELTPARAEEGAATLILAVDPRRLEIRMLVVSGEMQDRMVFRFHDVVENGPMDADLFRFTPPADVEVIEE